MDVSITYTKINNGVPLARYFLFSPYGCQVGLREWEPNGA
jgi:hypothetical protein